MLSAKARSFLKDVALVGTVFLVISGSYYGFAVAERYRALTRAYLNQAQQLSQILNRTQGAQNAQETPQPSAGSEVEPQEGQ